MATEQKITDFCLTSDMRLFTDTVKHETMKVDLLNEDDKYLDLCPTYSCTSGSRRRDNIILAAKPDPSLFELISSVKLEDRFVHCFTITVGVIN